MSFPLVDALIYYCEAETTYDTPHNILKQPHRELRRKDEDGLQNFSGS